MLKYFFAILRWPNLLMLAAIQLIVYYKLLVHTQSVMSLPDILILIFITMMIGAGGYIINDVYDTAIDEVNKPHKKIVGTIWTIETTKRLYWSITCLGLFFSVWLAIRLGLYAYIFIYPLAVGGLWFYSFALKCKPLVGNVWVSIFCAGVITIIALPDMIEKNLSALRHEFWFYVLFAFLTTLLREVIKDMEDVEGDARTGCRTVVVELGVKACTWMVLIIGLLLIISLFIWEGTQTLYWVKLMLLMLQGACVGALAFVWWARDKSYYHKASTIIKFVMLGGTLILLIYP